MTPVPHDHRARVWSVRPIPSRRCTARWRRRSNGDPDLAVYPNEVTTAGRIELLPFLHEQSITITAHRFGNPDDWSESVI